MALHLFTAAVPQKRSRIPDTQLLAPRGLLRARVAALSPSKVFPAVNPPRDDAYFVEHGATVPELILVLGSLEGSATPRTYSTAVYVVHFLLVI